MSSKQLRRLQQNRMSAKQVQHDLYAEMINAFVERRHELGIPQIALDGMIGCAEGLVAKWESGARNPSPLSFAQWAVALGCRFSITPEETES